MSNKPQALVVLCGGRATRLKHLAADRPKALMEVLGKPFLEHLVGFAARAGIAKIVLAAGHLGRHIVDFKNRLERQADYSNLSLTVVQENEPLGTGGAVLNLLPNLPDSFAVCNADTVFDFRLDSLIDWFDRAGAESAVVGYEADITMQAVGRMLVDDLTGRVIEFSEKTSNSQVHECTPKTNCGFYLFRKNVLRDFKPGRVSLEETVLPELVRTGKLFCFSDKISGFHDYGTIESLAMLGSEKVRAMDFFK